MFVLKSGVVKRTDGIHYVEFFCIQYNAMIVLQLLLIVRGWCARVCACVSVSMPVCVHCSDGLCEEAVSESVRSCFDGPVPPARGYRSNK